MKNPFSRKKPETKKDALTLAAEKARDSFAAEEKTRLPVAQPGLSTREGKDNAAEEQARQKAAEADGKIIPEYTAKQKKLRAMLGFSN